jgi:hypothetical protein
MKPNIEIVANWWFCSLNFSYTNEVILILTLLIWTVISTPILGLLLLPIGYMRVNFAWQATMVAWQAMVAGCRKEIFLRPKLVQSYEEILMIACEEASEWSMSNPTLDVHLTYSKPSSLEGVLQKQGMPIFALLQ